MVGTEKGQRTKLATPKTQSAAALLKGKTSTSAKRCNGAEKLLLLSVRRKPLADFLEVPVSSSTLIHGISYAAAAAGIPVPLGYTSVKVLIPPRFKQTNKSGKSKVKPTTNKSNFSIFDVEQPKSHIVHISSKAFHADLKATKQSSKLSKKKTMKYEVKSCTPPPLIIKDNDVDVDADKRPNGMIFKSLACAKVIAVPIVQNAEILMSSQDTSACTAENAISMLHSSESLQTNQLSLAPPKELFLPSEEQQQENETHPVFSNISDYLDYHHKRLQRILEVQEEYSIVKINTKLAARNPEINFTQFEDPHYKQMETACFLAQNRAMVYQTKNPDELIY